MQTDKFETGEIILFQNRILGILGRLKLYFADHNSHLRGTDSVNIISLT